MKVLCHSDADFAARRRELTSSSSLFDPVIEQRARDFLAAVQQRGCDAQAWGATETLRVWKLLHNLP